MVTELLEKKTQEQKLPYFLLTSEVKELLRFESLSAFLNFAEKTPDFPKPFSLGIRRKAYVREEVINWINTQIKNRQ